MAKRKVLLTGACGYVSGRMLDAMHEKYDLTLMDVKTTNSDGEEVAGVNIVDLLNRDRDAYRKYFKGIDTVVHSGFKGTVNHRHTDFWKEHDNVMMCYNVYQTCIEENVRRVVTMSSNHAADFYEPLIWEEKIDFVTKDDYPLTDNFYGWGKISYESLGFVFATGSMNDGKVLESVQIRIGAPRENVAEEADPNDLKKLHRGLGAYLSARDQTQLVIKSIEAEDIDGKHGIPFQVFYGVSGNSHRFWGITDATKKIGYVPDDNSAVKFADKVADIMNKARDQEYGDS
ncbi:MAG: NAD-dependent epimerase/dehydratase family protein [Candidatus Latescibacterota bacterium]|nr:NAD-dependent epimerase/dehydratase family protein [Candidatus Latescibacterota bacterium]